MRLTTRTNLAMRTLMYCAVNHSTVVRKAEIARACNASENHLAQVIHLLAQRGFLTTVRGRAGGLMLSRPADAIRLGDVFRALESSLPFTECFDQAQNSCPLIFACRLKGVLAGALEAFYCALDPVTVEDLVLGNSDLEHIMKVA